MFCASIAELLNLSRNYQNMECGNEIYIEPKRSVYYSEPSLLAEFSVGKAEQVLNYHSTLPQYRGKFYH